MNINYDHYRTFYHVAKYRSITRAASVLMANQPNVTRTIKNLESDLGCILFIRSNQGMQLTPEGEKLYEHVRIAFEHLEAAEEELAMDRTLQHSSLSIGATEVALRCLLLPILKEYHRLYPGIRLRVSNHSTSQAISALKNGMVDIAVVTTPVDAVSALRLTALKDFHEIAVCGPSYAHLADRVLSLRDLEQYPLISLGKRRRPLPFTPSSSSITVSILHQTLKLRRLTRFFPWSPTISESALFRNPF